MTTKEAIATMTEAELREAIKAMGGGITKLGKVADLRKRALWLLARQPVDSERKKGQMPRSGGGILVEDLLKERVELADAKAAKKKAPADQPAKDKPAKVKAAPAPFEHDHRVLALHKIGDYIEKRDADGKLVAKVQVAKDGFAWRGKVYESLSPIAEVVTGTAQSGLVWLGIVPYNARERKGKTTAELAPSFATAAQTYNLVAKALSQPPVPLDLEALEASEDHAAVRKHIASLRAWAGMLRGQLAALALAENLLEVRHGRVIGAEPNAGTVA